LVSIKLKTTEKTEYNEKYSLIRRKENQ